MKTPCGALYFFIAFLCSPAFAQETSDKCLKLKGDAFYACYEKMEKKALGSMPYQSDQYKKSKLICTICDDVHTGSNRRTQQGFGSPFARGRQGTVFTNQRLSDDLQRYRLAYGEHFQIKRCKDKDIKEICHNIEVITEYHKRKAKEKRK